MSVTLGYVPTIPFLPRFSLLYPSSPPLSLLDDGVLICFFGSGSSPQFVGGPRGVPGVPVAAAPVGFHGPQLSLVKHDAQHVAPDGAVGEQ